jgi:fatty acid-binding protein DegV
MDKFIARANITHLREKLETEQDETKRQILQRLLTEQEASKTSQIRASRLGEYLRRCKQRPIVRCQILG